METLVNPIASRLDQTTDNVTYKNRFLLWSFLGLALFSFLTTLQLPYLGEEAVYTISSLEMWYHHQWFSPLLYGAGYGRPPLFNWCIIPLANFLGWENVLLASRMVASLATCISAVVLFGLTNTLFRNKYLALFSVCIYFSGDLLLRRGWLAYADPLFAMGVFIAIASAWLTLAKNQKAWLVVASLGLISSYLSKALTGYVFYGISVLVLLYYYPNRRLFWSPFSLIMHFFAVSFVFLWDRGFTQQTNNEWMLLDILNRFTFNDISSYLLKLLLYPFDTFIRFFPYGALLIYFGWKYKKSPFSGMTPQEGRLLSIAVGILIFNILPYWISPFARVRYLLPLYPFFAMVVAVCIFQWGEKSMKTTLYWMAACLVLKYALALYIDPFYEKHYRGDYRAAAQNILQAVGDFPLYTKNVSSTGLSVTANIDILRLPKAPITIPPEEWTQGFLLYHVKDFPNTDVAHIFVLGSHKVYLLKRVGGQVSKVKR